MPTPRPLLLGLALLTGVSACTAPEAGRQRGHDPQHVLSAEQIAGFLTRHPGASAHDAVWHYRRLWLARRQAQSFVWLYEGTALLGDADRILRGIPLTDVRRLEYLDPRAATTRFGRGHLEGAIVIFYGSASGDRAPAGDAPAEAEGEP